jgi:hypothetical protein
LVVAPGAELAALLNHESPPAVGELLLVPPTPTDAQVVAEGVTVIVDAE